jgi:hypothetical protein
MQICCQQILANGGILERCRGKSQLKADIFILLRLAAGMCFKRQKDQQITAENACVGLIKLRCTTKSRPDGQNLHFNTKPEEDNI